MEAVRLSRGIYVEYPSAPEGIQSSTNVLIFNGWTSSKLKYLQKYAPLYREKNYLIFYVESPSQVFWSTDPKEKTNLHHFDSAIRFLKDNAIDVFSKSGRAHVIIHNFSNGGVNQLWKLYLNLEENSLDFNVKGLIFDSAPGYSGSNNLSTLHPFIRAAMIGPSKSGTWDYWYRDVAAYITASIVVPMYAMFNILGIRNLFHSNEDAMYSPRFAKLPRLFMYTRVDLLVTSKDVEIHIKKCKDMGVDVDVEVWQDAAHVKLLVSDTEKYSKCVDQFVKKVTS
ncbi:hypothetical protein HK098_006802 [Nowakowskiella sp. JEL0407]|nr:hypothetical protein HK098_006802 [Nowakowskiella sp. JEL0407]